MQSILATSGDSLENLAVMADKITDIEQPQIAAVTQVSPSTTLLLQTLIKEIEKIKINQRSFHQTPNQFRPPLRSREPYRERRYRNRSNSRQEDPQPANGDLCWYHATFKEKSRKCVAPFKYFSSGPEN